MKIGKFEFPKKKVCGVCGSNRKVKTYKSPTTEINLCKKCSEFVEQSIKSLNQ